MHIITPRCQEQPKRKTIAPEKKQTSFEKALDRTRRMHIIRSRPKKQGEKQESCLTKKLQNDFEIGLTKPLTERPA